MEKGYPREEGYTLEEASRFAAKYIGLAWLHDLIQKLGEPGDFMQRRGNTYPPAKK